MDLAREIVDGTFSVVQSVDTKKLEVKRFNEVIYEEVMDRLLPFEHLIAILMRERTKYFMNEGGQNNE